MTQIKNMPHSVGAYLKGVGVESVELDSNNHLIVHLDNGKKVDAGEFKVDDELDAESTRPLANKTLSSLFSAVDERINTLVGGNATEAIDTLNEIIAFLQGFKDSETLASTLVEINNAIAEVENDLQIKWTNKGYQFETMRFTETGEYDVPSGVNYMPGSSYIVQDDRLYKLEGKISLSGGVYVEKINNKLVISGQKSFSPIHFVTVAKPILDILIPSNILRKDEVLDNISAGSTLPVQSDAIAKELQKKVDKEDGKGLSTNDYTNEEKEQVERVRNGSVVTDNTLSALDKTSNKPVSGKGIASAIEEASNGLKQNEQLMSNNVELIGEGDTLVKANFKADVLEGHTIRVHIKYPNVDYTDVTYTSSSYDRFVISFRNASGALISAPVYLKCNTFDALASYYDLDVPAGTIYMMASMRAANGFVQILTVEDITEINRLDKINYDQNKYAKEPYTIDVLKGEVYPKAAQINVSPTFIGLPLSEVGSSSNNNCKNYIVDIPDNVYWIEISGHYNTTSEYGSMLLDEDNRCIVPIINRNHIGDNMAIPCPPNARRMLVSVIGNIPTIICHPYNDGGDALSKIDEVEEPITNFMSLSSAQTEGYQPSIVGQNYFKSSYNTNERNALCYLVPIKAYKQLSGEHFKTGSNYGSVFLDKYCNVVKHISTTDDTYIESTIPSEAVYFVYVAYKSMSNSTLTLSNKVVDKDEHIFVNGHIVDGEVMTSSKTLLLPSIKMDKGFHISLNEDYEFQSAHLYYNGEIVCTDFVPNPSGGDGSIATPFQYFGNKVFSANQILPQMSIRLVVKRTNGTEIRPSDLVIKEWTTIDYSEFKRLDAESIPANKAKIARKRLNQLLNLVWKAEEDILPANPADYKATHYKKGRTYIGTPYSEASEFSKYIGWCVSFRTFLTACMNKRSVMYTERISSSDKKSTYGFDYNGLSSYYCNPYFGLVCTGLTQYVLNLPNLYISDDYHLGKVPNTTKIEGATSTNVQPFDCLWNEGHCSLISDILLDEDGNRKYIVWAEQTFPVAKNSVYTLEEFDKRCAEKSIEVWRYDNWDTVTEPEATPYIQQTKYEWQIPLSVDKDIHIFTGDYSAFAKEDPLFINVNRDNGKYSSVQVFSEDDTTLTTPKATINITSLASDGLYAGEDWVIVDLTSVLLGAGKYKIRAHGDNTSGFAHFEIVEVTLNASGSNVTFEANGGTPVLLRRESQTGLYNGVLELTPEQVEHGEATTPWTYNDTHKYLKLYVQADYGIVVKRVLMI